MGADEVLSLRRPPTNSISPLAAYYRAFALWRLAAMVEGAYSPHYRGRDDSAFPRNLEFDVPRLLEEAAVSLGVASR